MMEEPGAELDIDTVGRMGEQIGAQASEHDLEHRNRNQPQDQDVERAKAAMHQHFVDDHLKEQRRHQREKLQEERGEQHLAQKRAIFVDRAHEPGDVEASRELGEAGPPGHQDEASVPRGLELGPAHHRRPCAGRLHDRLAVGGLSENQEAAVAQRDDGRQRRPLQPLPGRRNESCFIPNCFAQRSISLVPIASPI